MSTNLTVSFDCYKFESGPVLCHQRLSFRWHDYELFERIREAAVPLPEGVSWYGDEGLEETHTDPYGALLTWMPAHTLARLWATVPLRGWDLAVLGFLEALPPGTRVILWWH